MYNPVPDLILLGGFVAAVIGMIFITSTKPKPYKKYHMIDQAKRWER